MTDVGQGCILCRMSETKQHGARPAFTLGWRLRRSLEHAEMEVQDMADQLEVSRSTVSRWLHDEIEPKTLFLREWAVLCGVDYDWLIEARTTGRPKATAAAGGGMRPKRGRGRKIVLQRTGGRGLTGGRAYR